MLRISDRFFDALRARLTRRSGTYNQQDPTAFVRYEGKRGSILGPLSLHDVTWGIELKWRGRRLAYRDMDDRRWRMRPVAWLYGGLEASYERYEARFEQDPMGPASRYI